MRFAIFLRLNIFAFCVLLNLHETEGLPPMMSRFLDRFVYRRGHGKRHVGQRHRPAVFDERYPADTEIVFRLADSYSVPSVDYSQIDFGQTYPSPPVENTYVAPPTAPISLHHYNSVSSPSHYSNGRAPSHYSKGPAPSHYNYGRTPNHYTKAPAVSHYNQQSVTSTGTSSYSNTGAVSRPRPAAPVIKQQSQSPSQIINSLREPTGLKPPPPPSSINSILNQQAFTAPPSSINGINSQAFTDSPGLNPPPPPSSINSNLNPEAFTDSLAFKAQKGDLLPLIEIGKTPPPKYKVSDNFQQSFQVTLTSPGGRSLKKRSFQDSNSYASQNNDNGFIDLNTSGYTAQNNGYTSQNNGYTPQNNYGAPQSNYGAPQNNYGAPSGTSTDYSYNNANNIANANPVKVRTKQGSVVTRNKIYFSPRLLAHRSQPYRIARRIPPQKPVVNIFTPTNKTVDIINNVSSIVERTEEDRPQFTANKIEEAKAFVAVRLQSYSTLMPPPPSNNDSDLVEAQKDYGFGGHTFLFGSSDSLLSVFEMLLRTDFENKGGQNQFANANQGGYGIPSLSSGNSLEDTIDCIKNFVNATERIHFWSHSRGEADAGKLFQVFPRDPIVDAIPFIDTATVTDTLSATVF